MKHHHARGPEETVCDLPPVVPAGRASRIPPTCLREAGMPDVAPTENPSPSFPFPILFPKRVTSTEHHWASSRERRRRDQQIGRYTHERVNVQFLIGPVK